MDECRRRGGAGRGLSQGQSWRGSRIRGFDPLPCAGGVVPAHLCSESSLGCSGVPVDTCGGVAAGQGRWGCPGAWAPVTVGESDPRRWLPRGGSLFSQDSKEAEGRSLQDPQGA